ncbi:hypothetical protein [Bacillus sp. NSP9.1]|uniref:hypothetical protein n=1 Tax=Bacillus sp. NSP9.1 TaxID=1071078 RepID=UPI002E2A3BE9|nr:hypothetical protein [Bacillus sp. NSP9.1]
MRPWNLTGKAAEKLLDEAGITVKKNTIPYDREKSVCHKGIRMGSALLLHPSFCHTSILRNPFFYAFCFNCGIFYFRF